MTAAGLSQIVALFAVPVTAGPPGMSAAELSQIVSFFAGCLTAIAFVIAVSGRHF